MGHVIGISSEPWQKEIDAARDFWSSVSGVPQMTYPPHPSSAVPQGILKRGDRGARLVRQAVSASMGAHGIPEELDDEELETLDELLVELDDADELDELLRPELVEVSRLPPDPAVAPLLVNSSSSSIEHPARTRPRAIKIFSMTSSCLNHSCRQRRRWPACRAGRSHPASRSVKGACSPWSSRYRGARPAP